MYDCTNITIDTVEKEIIIMKNIFEGHNFIGLISITKKRHISVQGHSFDKTVSCFPTDTWQKMCVSTFVHIANHTLQLHRKYDHFDYKNINWYL